MTSPGIGGPGPAWVSGICAHWSGTRRARSSRSARILQQPAEREDIATPQEYYARVNPAALGISPEGVVERGRQAGRDLGDDPAATVDALVSRVFDELSDAGDPLIEVIGGAGIRLHTYLPTRTFELAVHGLDIARAVGISFALPADVLEEATGWRRASRSTRGTARRCCWR